MKPVGRGNLVRLVGALVVIAACGSTSAAWAQGGAANTLRSQVERRFDVLVLREGVALKSRTADRGAHSIELSGDAIAVDGTPVSGAELREKLGGPDAELVLRLSYLTPEARRALFAEPAGRADGAPDVSAQPPVRDSSRSERRSRRGPHSDVRVRFGGDVTVGPDETVADSVVVVGGSARIDGQVEKDVVVIGGALRLGPTADVAGDVAVIGGTLDRDPLARIGGKVNEVGTGALPLGDLPLRLPFGWWGSFFGAGFALLTTVARFAVLCLVASIVVLLARDHVERISTRASEEPLKAAAVGVLAELLFIPLLVACIVVLVVTIVGIPLLVLIPFAILALAVVFVVGFTSVAYRLGGFVCGRAGYVPSSAFPVVIAGIATVMAPVLLARLVGFAGGLSFGISAALVAIGLCVEYVAWTIGLGAVALQRFGGRHAPAAAADPIVASPPA